MTNLDLNSSKAEDLLRKIRALKAKAEDAATTEAESMAFAAKVAELLAKHNLEEAQLNVGQDKESDPLGHEDYISNWNASPARRVLVIAVCRLYNVKPLIRSRKGAPWTLIGRPHNIIMVKEMTAYLIETTLRLARQYKRSDPLGNEVDFKRGCFKRLSERLYDLYLETVRGEAVFNGNNPGNLPALYMSENKLMDAYRDKHWPNTRTMRPQRIKQGASALAGRLAGSTVSLHRQVSGNGNGGSKALLLGKK